MTKREKINYQILSFLYSAKKDINITNEILRSQIKDVDDDIYQSQVLGLQFEKAIAKTSPNKQWQITQVGEEELNRLKEFINNDTSSNLLKTSRITQLLAITTSVLGVIGLWFQCYFAYQQNEISLKQTEIMENDSKLKTELDTEILNFYITSSKDGKTHIDSVTIKK